MGVAGGVAVGGNKGVVLAEDARAEDASCMGLIVGAVSARPRPWWLMTVRQALREAEMRAGSVVAGPGVKMAGSKDTLV